MALAVEGGVLSGLDLADVIHRTGAVAPGALARRDGRIGGQGGQGDGHEDERGEAGEGSHANEYRRRPAPNGGA